VLFDTDFVLSDHVEMTAMIDPIVRPFKNSLQHIEIEINLSSTICPIAEIRNALRKINQKYY
tara:strand:+ start:56825 stop:57010 length:186 start_codon:yes stop_codon:yes gene_type:complete